VTPVLSVEPSLIIRISRIQSPEDSILSRTFFRLPEQLYAGIITETVI
jgi:hypothetical protein